MTSRILIVDNDPAFLDWYSEGLSDSHRIDMARTGRAAVERVKRRNDLDLAVIDYQLPDMTGVAAMKELKDLAPSVPVIIVTAYGDEDTAIEAFRSGARDYLKKPFSISELSSKIDFYLALRRADKRHRKNVVPAAAALATMPSAVTLSQYHKVQRAVRFINDNYRTDIRLGNAAREAGMSRSHFSRVFRKVMGLSYQDYLNRRRIAKARNLLRTTPQTVTEIALSLGFADSTGFGRIFKKLTGYTPSACRSLPEK
jgi:YesN/AraC family two-component response regulator